MNEHEVRQLHAESIIIDGLNASYFLDERVLWRLHAGGVTAVNATIAAWHPPLETMDMIAAQELFLNAPSTQGFESISACFNVTQALLAHGYSTEDTHKILGGNWLRLYTTVWAA